MRTGRQHASESGTTEEPRTSFRRRRAGRASSALMVVGFLVGSGLLVALGIRFPGEATRWMENQDAIRTLQEENANLRKHRSERLDRLKSFRESFQEQELEIRRQYNLYKPNDTVFMLPQSQPDSKVPGQQAPTATTPQTH